MADVVVVMDSDYDDSWVVGVYSTLDLAKAAFPRERVEHHPSQHWWSRSDALRIKTYQVDPEAPYV